MDPYLNKIGQTPRLEKFRHLSTEDGLSPAKFIIKKFIKKPGYQEERNNKVTVLTV